MLLGVLQPTPPQPVDVGVGEEFLERMIEYPGPCPQNPLVGLVFHVEHRPHILTEKEIGGVELP